MILDLIIVIILKIYLSKFLDSQFLNSTQNIRLKKDLHQGTKAKSCEKCWLAEDNGRISLRQKLNGVLTKNASTVNKTWIDSYFKRKDNFKSEDVLMADVKIGNTCNFACVMCVPEDSSMIYNEWQKKLDSNNYGTTMTVRFILQNIFH